MALFYIAIIPSILICEEVIDFKRYADEHFNSRKAFRSPAHITLQPPFQWNVHDLHPIRENLKTFVQLHQPFEIQLRDFKAFPPRVIYIDVVENSDLTHLHHSLQENMATNFGMMDRKKTFEPHITIAYKDLDKAIFPKAWQYYSKVRYRRTFMLEALTILKYNGTIWEIFEKFKLGAKI